MKRIEVIQSGKGMKKELNPLGESENFEEFEKND